MTNTKYLSPDGSGGLLWGPLQEGVLIKRHKRFLAEVSLPDGREITAHTPNTGSMTGCSEPGRKVWLSHHDSPTRKLKYTLEMIEMPESMVGVNTGVPNKLVAEAFRHGLVEPFKEWRNVAAEVKVGLKSRLDLKLGSPAKPDVYVEIKNCTLVENQAALFPDARTERGLKHLEELSLLVSRGFKAVIFILVQRADGRWFSPADRIDPLWGRALRDAIKNGVTALAYRADLSPEGLSLGPRLEIKL